MTLRVRVPKSLPHEASERFDEVVEVHRCREQGGPCAPGQANSRPSQTCRCCQPTYRLLKANAALSYLAPGASSARRHKGENAARGVAVSSSRNCSTAPGLREGLGEA
jgi:hypothetical protein